MKSNQAILSVDFSKNYDNKQHHEIQSAYFGHEAFTLYTAACYFKMNEVSDVSYDNDTNLNVLPAVIVSNETNHERNIAFSCNNKLLDIIRNKVPELEVVYFWSDGCASQFRSRFVFKSFLLYPRNLNFFWGLWGSPPFF